jgi:hypothetical protein
MSKVVQGARVLIRRTTAIGMIPSIPLTNDHTLGWLDSDIYEGEIFSNLTDKRIWIRTSGTSVNDAITEFAMLDTTGKLPYSLLPVDIVGSVIYEGTWDASTGNPPSIHPIKGNYWVVSVAGSTNLDGIDIWKITDWAIYNGIIWEKVDNTVPQMDATVISYENAAYPTLLTVADALNKILYAPPTESISNNVGNVEIGSTITSVTLTWSVNKTMVYIFITDVIGNLAATTNGVIPLTGLALTSNKTYAITAVDDHPTTGSTSTTISFLSKRYWGTNSENSGLSSPEILTLTSSELASGYGKSFTISNGGGNYIYYCYPASFNGIPTFTVSGLSTTFILTTTSHTNASGYTSIYNVWRSLNTQSGINIPVVIS